MIDADTVRISLTLQEKIGQLNQRLKGWECVTRTAQGYAVTDVLRCEVDRFGGLGALYGLFRADPWSGVSAKTAISPEQRADVAGLVTDYVINNSNHGIPPLLVEEAPHGHMAYGGWLFPVNLAVAASWDLDGAKEAARITAEELRASGAHLALLSGLDIARDPRWGRSEESYGEDPDLAAAFVGAVVEGMSSVPEIGVVLKHFAGQGAGIGGRNASGAPIGPHELAEIHLPAALRGVRAGAVGLMAAYNDIDGVPCVANRWLLTELLRQRWDFDGLVMADGGAVDRLIGITGSREAAAATALKAGVDLSLWDESFTALEDAVDQDLASEADIDLALDRVLGVKARLGLLDESSSTAAPIPSRQVAESIALRLAERAVVALKTSGTGFPLPPAGTIAVVGPNADDLPSLLGDYTPPIDDHDGVATALARRPGFAERVVGIGSSGRSGARWAIEDDDIETARRADVVVAVLGDTSERLYDSDFEDNGAVRASAANIATSGEGADVASVELPAAQLAFLEQLATLGVPVVTVIVAGRARALDRVAQMSDAVLFAPFPGPAGADGIARVLTGEVAPSGRLPVTLPTADGVLPVAHDLRRESALGYVDVDGRNLPLGYAITSSVDRELAITTDAMSATELIEGGSVEAELTLINRADHPVRDVVPIFGRRTPPGHQPRRRELLTFVAVELAAAEQRTIVIQLGAEELLARDRWGMPTVAPSVVKIGLASEQEVDLDPIATLVIQILP